MNKGTAKYGVFHDIPKASPIKIHISKCPYFQRHDPNAPTTEWFYTNNLDSANKIAKQLAQKYNMKSRDCYFCKPNKIRH